MSVLDAVSIAAFALALLAIITLPLIANIARRVVAKRHPPTTEPRPGITDARNCPTINNACRRDCAGRCWHEE